MNNLLTEIENPISFLENQIHNFEKNSNCISFNFMSGLALFKLNRVSEAIELFKKCLYENPSFSLARVFLGLAYYKTFKFKQAKEQLKLLKVNLLNTNEIVFAIDLALKLNSNEYLDILYKNFEKKRNVDDKNDIIFSIYVEYFLNSNDKNYWVKKLEPMLSVNEKIKLLENMSEMKIDKEIMKSFLQTLFKQCLQNEENTKKIMTIYFKNGFYFDDMKQFKYSEFINKIVKENESLKIRALAKDFYLEYLDTYMSKKSFYMKKIKKLEKDYLKILSKDTSNIYALLSLTSINFNLMSFQNENNLKKCKVFLEKLFTIDDNNSFYYKKYCEVLSVMGFLNEAENIKKMFIAKKNLELTYKMNVINKIISLYEIQQDCPLCKNEKNNINCPLCNDKKKLPYIEALMIGTPPKQIFAPNISSKSIKIKEDKVFNELLDNQPIFCFGRKLIEFFAKKGSFINEDVYPITLPLNSVFINIKLTNEKLRELLDKGIPMEKLDLYLSNINLSKNNSFCDSNINLNTQDFVVEIVHSLS